ncbi:MAG: ketol-acid reductoisomerase [Candidatus Krumholzibacteriia bacterium]
MKVYREEDVGRESMRGARTAIIGYGNQGHAHALNLKESGADVVVGARRGGAGWARAESDGFEPLDVREAVEGADYVVMLLPDEAQAAVFGGEIREHLKAGAALVFAHGFTIGFGEIEPPPGHDVILVAPKGQGHFLRKLYTQGRGLMCLVAVERDASGSAKEKMLSYAHMLGCLRAGAIETTFREEAVTDLFGEQAVLCGGAPALVKAAFDTLVERGYDPHVAYIECLHELQIITDLMARGGLEFMREKISRTAAWGSYVAEETLVTEGVRARMKSLLTSIESGEFARGWRKESRDGQHGLRRHIAAEAKHPIESAGIPVRALMTYLKEDDS